MFPCKLKVCAALVLGLAVLGLEPAAPAQPPASKQSTVKEKPANPKAVAQTQPESSDRIEAGDRLRIRVPGTLPDLPIHGIVVVEASGKVALGPGYGRVEIKGRTLEAAEKVIAEHLSAILKTPVVSVTRYDPIADASATQGAVAAQLARLEQRMEQVEKELQSLRRLVEKLDKKPRD